MALVQASPREGRLAIARLAPPRTLALISLLVLVAACAVAAVDAGSTPQLVPAGRLVFPRWLQGPLAGAGGHIGPASVRALLLVMLGAWLLALRGAVELPRRVVAGVVVLAHVICLLAPPLLSADVFGYVGFARIGVVHHLDPYLFGTGWAPSDPVHPFLRWRNAHSPYGPLFTLLSYALVPLGVAGAVWAFKLLACAASLGTIALVWRLAERRGHDPRVGAILIGLSPPLLLFEVAGGHNDALATFIGTVAIALMLSRREASGLAWFVVAGAIKLSGGLAAPFALAGSERPRRALLGAVGAGVAVVAVSAAAFRQGAPASIASAASVSQGVATFSVPNVVAGLLHLPSPGHVARAALTAAVAACVLLLLVRAWRGADWVTCAGWATVALLCGSTWLLPWYATWAMPLAALGDSRRLRGAVIAFAIYVTLTRAGLVPGGPYARA